MKITRGSGPRQPRVAAVKPRAPAKKIDAFERAQNAERAATLDVTRAGKAEHIAVAVSAWIEAATTLDAFAGARMHGAHANAHHAAARLTSLLDDAGAKRVARALTAALDTAVTGRLHEARAHFADALREKLPLATRADVHAAMRAIDAGVATLALDELAAAAANVPGSIDEAAEYRALAAQAQALGREHPTRALDFMALAVESAIVASAGRELAPAAVAELQAQIKECARAQSATRTPAVAQKALLLAVVAHHAGNAKGARGAYLRVLEMTHATPTETRAARVGLAQLALARGDRAGAAAHAREIGGALAHAVATVLAGEKRGAQLLADAVAGGGSFVAARGARKLPEDARLLALLAAEPVLAGAGVPLAKILDDKSFAPMTTTQSAGFAAALACHVELLPACAQTASVSTLAGMLQSHRGDASRASKPPLELLVGLEVARVVAQLAPHDDVRPAHAGPAPSAAQVARARADLAVLRADATHGPATIDDARAALVARGWGTDGDALVRDGMRIRFAPFSIAQTDSFRVVLERDDVVDETVHVGAIAYSRDEWRIFDDGFTETLARYERALHTNLGASKKAVTIDDIRQLVSLGRPITEMPAKRADLLGLAAKQNEVRALIADLQARGRMPKSAMIFVEGIDAASKTTNGMNLKALLEEAGFVGSWTSFKGPSAEERQQHWLARHQKRAPADGEVFLSDRTFLGDHAYNPTSTDEKMRAMAGDVAAWSRDMAAKDTLVVKMLFDPRLAEGEPLDEADEVLWRPMLTFGKREARALIARDVLERFRDELTDEERASLESATLGPGYNDLKSFHEGSAAMDRFRAFADACDAADPAGTPWVRIATKDRHAGRLKAYDALLTALKSRL